MDAGGLAQMSSNTFNSAHGLPAPSGGLSSRRGGQNIKPLSFDAIKQGNATKDGGASTPRTSRSHLLAGLRTAPKSAAATSSSFGSMSSPTSNATPQQVKRRSMAANLHGYGQDNAFNAAPRTALPQFAVQQQQSPYQNMIGGAQYTVDQVLAPPELAVDDQVQQYMDPGLYAQLVATNMYLAQQQQRLQQQLRNVQAAAQQFQQLNLNNSQLNQQQMALFEQQQQLHNMQQQLGVQAAMTQGQQVYYSPVTGQYYVDTSSSTGAAQVHSPYPYSEQQQPLTPTLNNGSQQQQQRAQNQHHQAQQGPPRVQVSPPPESYSSLYQSSSPPKRHESPAEVTPLPPPSANAFRRGHKKAPSLAPVNGALGAVGAAAGDAPKCAGPKSASFPPTPLAGSHGPGQARAGEHPVRQPRGPPSLDEIKSKPTAKHEGSKNFAARTRRSAVHNLVRAGLERRKGTGSSTGTMSPVSETAEGSYSPVTDNESDSGRSGSGSLIGEEECGSSRTSASGSWGAIGSNRPGSCSMACTNFQEGADGGSGRDSPVPTNEVENSSFANVFKNGSLRAAKAQDATDAPRKAPRLVLTSVEKRKATPVA